MDFAHHKRGARGTHRDLNVHPFVARLIASKMATLIELQTVYSYADMLYMDEVLNLNEEAEYLAMEASNGKHRS